MRTNAPTPRQLDYLRSLQAKVGVSREELETMMGWRIAGPFGSRLDNSRITRQSVSLAIDYLKRKVEQ